MPSFKISPTSALLTAGQAVTFQAVDDQDQPVDLAWRLTPQLGSLVLAAAPPNETAPVSQSATYVAPSIVQTAQTVAVTAASPTATGSITISLTPDAISILPAAVELHAGQKQQFMAILAGSGGDESITWILSPQVGELDDKGLYTAPASISDDGTISITAATRQLGRQVSSKVSLTPEPWRGPGTALLAIYIFMVFGVLYFMILLWPNEISNIDVLKTNQAQAQVNVDKTKLALSTGLDTAATSTDTTKDSAQKTGTETILRQLNTEDEQAQKVLRDANDKLEAATSPNLDTRMVKRFNREIDSICLILLAGALGSFLHMAQSFSGFTGNRTLKSSWVWWYCFLPFVGSALALVLYAAMRGGLITVAAAPTIKATDLNPYGLVAAAALAGMFSEAATTKLGEVFGTAFQSSKGQQKKDPIKPDVSGTSQPANAGATENSVAAKTM